MENANVITDYAFTLAAGTLWRRSGSAVECRTLDRDNTVTNPPTH